MIAASVWSLIIPAIEMSEQAGTISWLPATIGIILGTVFIPFCDKIINYEKINLKSSKENFMLALAIVIHNIPEGMAVGVAFASAIYGNFETLIMSAFVLSIGIAVQNFPEGAAISLPYRSEGMSRGKSFLLGMLSGVVEPIAGFLAIVFAFFVEPLLPYFLAFAGGTMIYVVVEEIVPEFNGKKIGTYALVMGFLIMMILDVALG